MHGPGHPGMGMHGKGAHGGGYHGSGGHHGGKHLLGPHWRSTLSEEQRAKLDALHLAFVKTKAPLMAKAKSLKVELALLATAVLFIGVTAFRVLVLVAALAGNARAVAVTGPPPLGVPCAITSTPVVLPPPH